MNPLSKTTHAAKICLIALSLMSSLVSIAQPVANFSASATSGCSPSLITFSDQSSGNPNYWKWDLGNGTTSYMQNPSVTYLNAGTYTIKLLVRNAGGTDSIAKTNYITINPAPTVAFSASAVTGCFPLAIQFSNQSSSASGAISSYQWDFGNGQLSTQQTPTYTYTQSGEYNVSLKVTDSKGCVNALQKTRFIKVNGVKSQFFGYVTNRCSSTSFQLSNSSFGNGTLSFKWNFGDGTTDSINRSPMHIFPIGGTYVIKLKVSNEFGCEDATSFTTTLDTLVTANFTSTNPIGCKPPFSVTFSSPQKLGNSYLWEFSDGSTSTEKTPTHLFNDTGSYHVRLKVVNVNGCADSIKRYSFVTVRKPFIQFDNLPDSACAPFRKSFYVVNPTDDPIIRYRWDFGDGFTSMVGTPYHTYSNFGYYNVKVTATTLGGCTDSVLVRNAIRVSSKPVANFNAQVRSSCAGTAVVLNNTSTGANRYNWDFGDNTTSTDQNPSHKFRDTGYLDLVLIAYNDGCGDTIVKNNYMYIKPAVSKFTFESNCSNPLKIKFTNASKGATSYLWNFGDGDTSTILKNPEHTYPAEGTYLVKLTVKNSVTGCEDIFQKNVLISYVKASFTSDINSICRGGAITFTATSDTTKVSKYTWDFGDGVRGYNARYSRISHVYAKPGLYTVKLVVTSLVNCNDTLTKTAFIKVDGPTAKFGLVSNGVCVNKETAFKDSTIADGRNAIQSWDWNFGDGHSQIFTAPPFTHVYDSINNYFVSLKVTDVRGCADSFTMVKTVNPIQISSRFMFSFYPNFDSLLGCVNSPFSFVCPFAEAGFTYKWDLGDNTYSSIQNFSKRYQTGGTYNIKLVVSNNAGCSDSTIRYNMVKIVEPIAKFSINDSFKTCPPLVVNFTDSSTYAISKTWNFGDSTNTTTNNPSHFYSYPGTYFAKLTVTGPGGCTSEAVKRIVVNGPRGTINYNATGSCKPYLFNFNVQATDAVQYTWDFNDGSTVTNSLTSMFHTYENAGKYIPKLMLVDGEGCRVAISSRDTILASFVDADFSQQVQNSCDTGSVRFLNTTQTNDRIASYKWLFGDGTSSVLKDADHKFAQDGIYTAKLIVTTATGCSDTATKSITIKRVAPPQFQIISTASGCVPLALSLQAQLTSTDTNTVTWKWKFPNGDSSSLQNPPAQLFNNAGNYTIRLSGTNSIGCTKEISKAIQTFASPIVNAGQDIELCEGATAQLNASGAITYEWTGQNLSCLNCSNPTVSALGDSKYIVKGTNVNGCFAKDSVLVKINKKAHVVVDSVANTCKGLSKQLQATGSSNYQWTPSIGLSNTTIANPIANIIATTSYRVIGTNNNACGADTAYLLVRVNENPTVNAGEDKIISAGSSVDLDPVYSSDVISFSWTPTGELFRAGSNAITVRPTENTEYTASVENRFGCKAQDKVKVTVACQKANVFIPNLFSPNGDNVNDVFFVRGIGLQKVRSIRIFNRWGQIVFSKNNFNANDAAEGWNGRYNGKLLSTDTYIYIAEVVCGNGTVFSLNGNISLVD